MERYRVYSGNWDVSVNAADPLEAVLTATEEQFELLKENFCVSNVIVVEKLTSDSIRLFSPVSVLQDIGQYRLAKNLSKYLLLNHDKHTLGS